MIEATRSYIGVSGIMRREDAEALLDAMPADGPNLMVGVLASAKTLRGEPVRRAKRYPPIEKISEIFPRRLRALNLVHYATDDADTLGDQLIALTGRLDRSVLHGFQLNVRWPDPSELHKHIACCGHWYTVLQIGPKAFEEIDGDAAHAAWRISRYGGLIDAVLLDGSGGEGVPMDAERLRPFIDEILLRTPDMGIGIAGGLGPHSMHLADPLMRAYPTLNIDAEGALRDPVSDEFDLDRAHAYVLRALASRERHVMT